ncbi:creatininase family protein [Verrucosispora sioxanthis]|uniref:Creatininase family protein n=1 Tax=Verrucosispora sioxanthis TaxID=2499994 RepID=A0A6M1L9U2_9ACTN|nr:creatininase family protein [Verrucosispora sioxanthis]NEE65903.1 creatininase family protein [Verrucosispora sioxanthis]NGM15013.1 creatininase family protein [Verrucosispora sioxanthis]
MDLISTATTTDEATRAANVAVLPVGSFEQHGDHLPLITDTIVACAVAKAVATEYDLLLLPPVTISCSQEHTGWPGSVSIRSSTLTLIITDVVESLRRAGVDRLVLVNGHGGNYVLSNVVQEANVGARRMALYPRRQDWETARQQAGLGSTGHDDMHAGEIETSLLLHLCPELVRPGYQSADHLADRPDLLVLGMRGYTDNGVIGKPSLATAAKGKAVLDSLTALFATSLAVLTQHT